MRPPRPASGPAPNGNLHTPISHSHHPVSKWQTRLQEMLTPSSSRAYAMGCAIITLLLLTVFLIFYFLGENTLPPTIIYITLYPLKCKHMYQTMSSVTKFHTSSVTVTTQNFDKQPKTHLYSSPAGRRSTTADGSFEGKGGCSHRAVAPDTGTAGAKTQPDNLKRTGIRRKGTDHPSSMLDWKRFASPVKKSIIIKKICMSLTGLFLCCGDDDVTYLPQKPSVN